MDTQLQLAKNVTFSELDDEAVLLNLNTGSYFGLNHVGVLFIKTLERNISLNQIFKEISEHYGMPMAAVSEDLNKLIESMLDNQLLEEVESV